MIVVTLGGREYELQPLPLRPARALREKIGAQVSGLAQALNGLDQVEITRLDQIGELVQTLGGLLAGSMDMLAEWLFEFSPALQADREWIEEHAFDEEMLKAFTEALKMLYPFEGMLKGMSGLAELGSLTSSHSASGGSGPTKSTRRP